ncbi:MAG: hypothetical protein PHW82_15805, partial [Bacteroidales bacterium]|nr:hypothetical protein [Bacteroidales bacterium]
MKKTFMFYLSCILCVALICAFSLSAEGKSSFSNLLSGVKQNLNNDFFNSITDITSSNDYVFDWADKESENSIPDVEMVKSGTAMAVTASSSSICVGSSVNITFTFNRGTVYPGTAEYSTNGTTWIALGTTSPRTINFSPTSTTTYYGRVRSTTSPVGTLYSGQTTVTVYSVSSSTPVLTAPADHAYLYSSTVNFSWTHTRGTHPNSKYYIEIDGGSVDKGTSLTHSTTVSTGIHTWRVRYYDGCSGLNYYSGYKTFYYYGTTTCGNVNHLGQDWTIASSTTLQGNHYNIGNFTVNNGVTVTVNASCHYFNVSATNINVLGTIDANGAGNVGGAGGVGGSMAYGDGGSGALWWATTTDCNGGYPGQGGFAGSGTGGGNAGTNGGLAGCISQICGGAFCSGNQNGYNGGGGGAGGGSGGSYGGQGGSGAVGGAGASFSSPATGGTYGSGGSVKATHGTNSGTDITWGSGGGGAGGGGGAFEDGTSGGSGGTGGGSISLIATNNCTVTGTLTANGTNGGNGGNGAQE